jgi:hypothetical protein
MTLVEVLAGLVVLGTVLASLVVARGRLLRQWADADRKLTAAHAVDELMSKWMSGPPNAVPVPRQGALAGAPDCVWRTQFVAGRAARDLHARVVRVEVFDARAPRRTTPLLTLDFLLRDVRQNLPAATAPKPAGGP